jgi:hypothetical protein
MKSFKLKSLAPLGFLALVAVGVMSCEKYEYIDNPPVVQGECDYTKRGFRSTDAAQLELNRLKNIFLSATFGSKPVGIIRSETFLDSTLNGKPNSWGMQLVFTCDSAQIKTESARYYEDRASAERDLAQRKASLEAGRYTKVLDWGIDDLTTEECETCCTHDDNGSNCGDCNCTKDYEYGYYIVYALVNPNNPTQAAIIEAFLENKAMLKAMSGKSNPNLTDTLQVARKILPPQSAAGKLVNDWYRLFSKVNARPAGVAKKPCPLNAKNVVPGSRHQVKQ